MTDTKAKSGVTLSWENLVVTVPEKKSAITQKVIKEETEILRNVSGSVQPGTLLAIMGASGSGKTTLLNVLTHRSASDLTIRGMVKVNGKFIGSDIKKMSAYVQQDDLFIGILTVREHLMFHAMLRMDPEISHEDRVKRVDDVILDLGLTKCKDSVIGIPDKVKSISGGERKRLSFASEVLTNPALLFCDEPTSGLDSFMAENVVQTLRTMASQGKTVLCTIHQPSSQTFSLFDNLLLMARGRIAFMGSTDKAVDFFARQGYNCPPQFNPADFYINTLAVVPGKETECIEKIDKICLNFKDSADGKAVMPGKTGDINGVANSYDDSGIDYSNEEDFKTGFFNQMKHVFWRSFIVGFRDHNMFIARLAPTVFVALFAGLLYLQQGNNQKGVQNLNGAIFLIIANSTFGNVFSVVSSFPLELPVFKRDHANGMYSTFVYFMSKTFADFPVFTFLPIVFSCIMYWMVGLREDAAAFFIFTGTIIFVTHIVVSYGYLISCAAGDVAIATALGGPLVVPLMLFGGFMINDASIPVYFIWIQWLSWFKYANEILLVNQWHNYGAIECEFAPSTSSPMVMTTPGPAPPFFGASATQNCTGMGMPQQSTMCYKTGEEVLRFYSYSIDNHARNFGCLAALLVGFRLIAFIILCIRVNPMPSCRKPQNKIDNTNQKTIPV